MPLDAVNTTRLLITIGYLIRCIQADTSLSKKQRAEYISALRCYARFLGLDIETSQAGIAANEDAITRFSPVAVNITEKRWANILSLVRKACERYAAVEPCRRTRWEKLTPHCEMLRAMLAPEKYLAMQLSAFLTFLSRHGITEVDDDVLSRFQSARAEASGKKHARDKAQVVIKHWNDACSRVPGFPQQRLTPLPSRIRYRREPWSEYEPSLFEEWTLWKQVCRGEHPRDPRSPDDPLAPDTIRQMTERLRYYFATLRQNGVSASDFPNFRAALQPKYIELVLKARLHENRPEETDPRKASSPAIEALAKTIGGVTRRWLQLEPDTQKLIDRAIRKVTVREKGFSERNLQRLTPFLDPYFNSRLYLLPTTLRELARKEASLFDQALMVQCALAIHLLLVAPMRIGELAKLEFEKHVILPSHGLDAVILLKPHDRKNKVRLQFKLSPRTVEFLKLYRSKYLPALLKNPASKKVFPGKIDGHKHTATLRGQIKDAVKKYVGPEIHPHLFRHFAAAMILKKNPEAFPAITELLGHKSMQTARDFYALFASTAASEWFYDEIVEPKLTGKPSVRGKSRK